MENERCRANIKNQTDKKKENLLFARNKENSTYSKIFYCRQFTKILNIINVSYASNKLKI